MCFSCKFSSEAALERYLGTISLQIRASIGIYPTNLCKYNLQHTNVIILYRIGGRGRTQSYVTAPYLTCSGTTTRVMYYQM